MATRPTAFAAACLLMACVLGENPAYETSHGGEHTSSGSGTDTGATAAATTDAAPTTAAIDSTDATAAIGTTTEASTDTCPGGQPLENYWLDDDNDGFGDSHLDPVAACGPPAGRVPNADDCDDQLAGIHPGVDEVCNGLDDDCDQTIDVPACAACTHITTAEWVYWVCEAPLDVAGPGWLAAEQRCAELVHKSPVHLLSVHEPDEYATILSTVTDRIKPDQNGTIHAWIGLSRQAKYDADCDAIDPLAVWQWTDGTAVDVGLWNEGEPSNDSGPQCECGAPMCPYENCTEIKYNKPGQISGWNDIQCDVTFVRGYVCKAKRDPDLYPLP